MGNLVNSIKRFLSHKNTMTIVLVVVGITVLYVAYNYRIEQQLSPVRIPYATVEISATQEITADKLGEIEVNSDFLNGKDIVTSASQVIGMYVTTGTSIPNGGIIYSSQVVEKNALPNAVFDDIPQGYTLFTLSVNENSTYGNSIYPGDRIDLYISVKDAAQITQFGKLVESIEVLAVRDSSQSEVFESTTTKTSAYLLFAVPDETFSLLTRALTVSGLSMIPVPRNKAYTEEGGATKVENATIEAIINSQTSDAS